jgi:oxygen-dependent protoporphyrinogen oxidase
LISVFVGGTRREDLFEKTDKEIKQIIEKEVTELMQIKDFNPILFKLVRYHHAIPQYGLESEARIEAIAQLEKQFDGLTIGGNLRDGIGMSDRIKQGTELAAKLCK